MADNEREDEPGGVGSSASVPSPHRRAAPALTAPRLEKGFLLVVVTAISLLLFFMIRGFLVAVILAGVFAAMGQPPFQAMARGLRGRRRLAAALTVLGLLLLIVVPLVAFMTLVVTQAVEVGESAGPWIRDHSDRWPELMAWVEALPLVGQFVPEPAVIANRAGEVVGRMGSFLINNATAATAGTVGLVLQLFIMLYAMYFFLLDGAAILQRLMYFTPLADEDERKLISQFVSVTRATIKGSLVVGLLQGALAGSAFFFLSLPGAAFWSTVMAVLSVIPVLGSGLVWAPAAVILMTTGRLAAGIGLALWGLVVVGLVDNFLRPKLVGRDTKMHDLMVLLSTFGGLAMFGVVGFIIGPIVAALFLTAWDLYGARFRDILPDPPSEEELSSS
jgi:predicted PurR-regulated permease PerM